MEHSRAGGWSSPSIDRRAARVARRWGSIGGLFFPQLVAEMWVLHGVTLSSWTPSKVLNSFDKSCLYVVVSIFPTSKKHLLWHRWMGLPTCCQELEQTLADLEARQQSDGNSAHPCCNNPTSKGDQITLQKTYSRNGKVKVTFNLHSGQSLGSSSEGGGLTGDFPFMLVCWGPTL